jgi:hypothetical protein
LGKITIRVFANRNERDALDIADPDEGFVGKPGAPD